ncbi:FAD-dependent monooxygenase, partial [Nitrospiraceae bacterium AH_259_D15_M11_P09]|nr:FAD-dependent monooxygenase [Nitrospiraceae bacterium AH_259_D15_M11_P09]
ESLYKPEVLQPAGLEVLHTLGVIEKLQAQDVSRCEVFDFVSIQGRSLCRVDYRALAHPFPYALIAFPHVTQCILLEKLADYPTIKVRWGSTLCGVRRSPGRPHQVTFFEDSQLKCTSASVVVGADGKYSRVREAAGIRTKQTDYRDAFITLVVQRPKPFGDAVRYFLGRRQILGMFPVSRDRLCLLYMVPAWGFDALKARGLSALKAEMSAVSEEVAGMLAEVTGWEQVSYMACRTVRASSWVQDGMVLIGDAAHACHPHVAQGSTQAMLDAVALAPVLAQHLNGGLLSADKLKVYEEARRPRVEALQRIAHEYAWLWNTGNPLLMWLRDRAFHEIGRRPRLLLKVAETEAGVRVAPLTVSERLQALGVLS